MSKDIRSFFTVKKTPGIEKKPSQETVKKIGQRKRAVILIDSDSEEELSKTASKRSKTSPASGNHKGSKRNEETKVATSKYFESKTVSACDIFGSRPIKRDNSRNIIKKAVTNEDKEFHIDQDLESELLHLDDVGLDVLSKDVAESSDIEQHNSKLSEISQSDDEANEGKHLKNTSELVEATKSEKRKDEETFNKTPNKKFKKETNQHSPEKQSKSNKLKASSVKTDREQLSHAKLSPTKLLPRKSPRKCSPMKTSPSKNILSWAKTSKISPVKTSLVDNVNQIKDQKVKEESIENNNHNNILTLTPEKKTKVNVERFSKQNNKKNFNSSETSFIASSNEKKVKSDINEDINNLSRALSDLWVEKYKPTTTKQIIGQQGEKSCVNKLTTWLKNWQHNQSGHKKLVKPGPWAKNDDGAYFKAALLSGPPGVGKTTTAHLVCEELGFDVVEFNASDTRSKKLLHQEVSELLSTNSLSPFFTGKGDQVTRKQVLLMDEVDGMAGNEDRGGVQELISLIKGARVPIICMCNDRNHPKIRSLSNYCFDLRFSKPRVEQIKGAMMSLCFKEKLKLTPDALTEIITSTNQDIRLIINHLSILSVESSSLASSTKHIKMGPWDVTRKIFSKEEHKTMSIYDKCDLFFHDYSSTPLFVQENYLHAVPHKPEAKNKIKKIELFASAARSLSLGDLAERSIRSHNAWGLLPVQAIFSSLVPGEILEGHLGAQINFPAWFGKNSRQTKMNRLLQELTVHSRLKISGNKEAMNLDYLVPLENSIVTPLVREGTAGIPKALSVLSEYCLIREDLESLSELSSWPNTKNQFSEVESKVKAAFTRAYNKTSAPTPYAAVPIKKGSKAEVENLDTIPEEEDVMQDIEDDEEDDLEVDAMIVVKKKQPTKKLEKEAAPSTSRGSKNAKRGKKK